MNSKALTIGQISYTNTLPVYFHFDQKQFADRVDFIQQVPAQLNKAMSEGKIDVGPISSFSYAEHHDKYLVLPQLSVSAIKKVRSIFLFSKKPLDELNGAHIALTNTSATSVNLLKVILQKFKGFTVSYETMQPKLGLMMEKADGGLLIGDEALLAHRTNKEYHVYDLAELWYEFTGYSMTFALWSVRKAIIAKQEDLLRDVHAAFLRSKEKSLANINELVAYVSDKFGGTPDFWKTYFLGLNYDFTDNQKMGLEYYYASCHELGLLPQAVKVSQWENVRTVKTTL